MKLTVPHSLVVAMNKVSLTEYKPIDVLMNLAETVRMISSYESKHGYIPKEWSLFLDDMNKVLTVLSQENQETIMTNLIEIETKRAEWITKLVFADVGLTELELRAFSMVELRDLYEETFPSYITIKSATATGGVKRMVTKISKPA
ncbi:MAG: hypothetical protein PHY47_00545 [Lachnospiraceae bacterium]|nr:hypothetical protein [Lachnospiraceae bacterium]